MHTIRDVMTRYCVTEATVLGWIHAGELPAINVGRKPGAKKPRWRITQAALDAFEAKRAASVAPAPARPRRKSDGYVPTFYT
jgi:hypothetical protein